MFKSLAILLSLAWAGAVSAQVVEFHIPAGPHDEDWNTRETMVVVHVGDTLKLVNDDTVVHALHTGGAPVQHSADIQPNGGSVEEEVLSTWNPARQGSLHDHYFQDAHFWIESLP